MLKCELIILDDFIKRKVVENIPIPWLTKNVRYGIGIFSTTIFIDSNSFLYNPTMSLGITQASNSSGVTYPNFTAISFNVVPSLCAFCAISADL